MLFKLTRLLGIFIYLLHIGKSRRVQFLECPSDINGMIDAAKIADLALLLIDGSYGFEMVCCQSCYSYKYS